jgi:hypothetical protein
MFIWNKKGYLLLRVLRFYQKRYAFSKEKHNHPIVFEYKQYKNIKQSNLTDPFFVILLPKEKKRELLLLAFLKTKINFPKDVNV